MPQVIMDAVDGISRHPRPFVPPLTAAEREAKEIVDKKQAEEQAAKEVRQAGYRASRRAWELANAPPPPVPTEAAKWVTALLTFLFYWAMCAFLLWVYGLVTSKPVAGAPWWLSALVALWMARPGRK